MAALVAWAGLAKADEIVTTDLNVVSGAIVSMGADGVLVDNAGKKQTVKLDDIEQIHASGESDVMGHTYNVLVTPAGSALVVTNLVMAGSKLKFDSKLLGDAKELDMGSVQWLYMPPPGKHVVDAAKICNAMKFEDKALDTVVVQRKAGDFWPLQGVLTELTADTVVFTRNDKPTKVARANVLAIRLASTGGEPAPALGRAMLSDDIGAWVEFNSMTIKDGTCELATKELGKLTVKQGDLVGVRMRNDRVTPLSSLEPAEVKEHGFLGLAFSYRKNGSTTGGPIRLGDTTYASGLGMHSSCELKYNLDGAYKQFVAVVGIDDGAKPAGNAQLVILGDGKELAKPLDLTGGKDAAPVTLRLKLDGVKVLTIRVDYGKDKVDVGDHVSLGVAKLIK